MVKPPRIRHSKPKRDPVTIDLDPGEVKRNAPTEEGVKADAADATPVTPAASGASTAPEAREAAVADARERPETDATGSNAGRQASSDEAIASGTPIDGPTEQTGTGPSAAAGAARTGAMKGGEDIAPSKPTGSASSAFGRDAARSASAATPKPEPGGPASRPASSTPPPARSEPPRKRSVMSVVAAGLVGGVIAIAGAGALQFAGVLPAPTRGAAGGAELEDQIAQLRAEIAAGRDDGGASDAIAAADARLGDMDGAIASLREELENVRNAVASGGAGDDGALRAFETRVDAIEEALAALRDAAPDAGETEALASRIDGIESIARTASEASAAAASAASAASERIAAVESQITAMNERLEQQAQNPRIALAIAAAGLKSAIDRGTPFMTELETYAAIAPEAAEIEALRGMAATGVPTRAQIAARAPGAVTRMIDAAEPVDPDAGFFARLLASFQSAVKVRPVGEVPGEGVGPTAARIEAAVQANDYGRALTEYETLPDVAKAAGADFIADLRARQTADELVERALSGALRA